MRVIFLEEVENVAKAGDVREVKNGFARNYLFPKELAVLATPDQLRRVDALKRAEALREGNAEARAEQLAPKLEGLSVTIEARSGPTGRLYGSVSSMAVAKAVGEAIDENIEARDIRLAEPIKAVGDYEITLALAAETAPVVTVSVIEAAPAKPTAKRKARTLKAQDTEPTAAADESSVAEDEGQAPEAEAVEEPTAEAGEEPSDQVVEEAPAAVAESIEEITEEAAVAEPEEQSADDQTEALQETPEEALPAEELEESTAAEMPEDTVAEETAAQPTAEEEVAAAEAETEDQDNDSSEAEERGTARTAKGSAAEAAVRRAKRRMQTDQPSESE